MRERRKAGGPVWPLLSNIVLDEFGQELERRVLRFVRYADDLQWLRPQQAGRGTGDG